MFTSVGRHVPSSCLRKAKVIPRIADDALKALQICHYRKKPTYKHSGMHHVQQQQRGSSTPQQASGIRTSVWNGVNSCQGDLLNHLKRAGHLRTPRVEQAMRAVDRRHFINPE
jgi:hypothetical protein